MEHDKFIEKQEGSLLRVECRTGKVAAIRHGFVGKGLLPAGIDLNEARRIVSNYLAVTDVVLPVQTHGADVVDLCAAAFSEECQGDAIIASRRRTEPLALCIRTADCVPLIVIGEETVALIHAGWRGLANGIVANVLTQLLKGEGTLQVIVGPCAGISSYEVGKEVIDAIGNTVVSRPIPQTQDKHLLDLEGTTRSIVTQLGGAIEVVSTGICTISDKRFYSHRRDGDKAGRNLTFVVIE